MVRFKKEINICIVQEQEIYSLKNTITQLQEILKEKDLQIEILSLRTPDVKIITKEIPVEKIVYVDRPVEIIKEVIKEVPVEKIAYIEKQTQQENITPLNNSIPISLPIKKRTVYPNEVSNVSLGQPMVGYEIKPYGDNFGIQEISLRNLDNINNEITLNKENVNWSGGNIGYFEPLVFKQFKIDYDWTEILIDGTIRKNHYRHPTAYFEINASEWFFLMPYEKFTIEGSTSTDYKQSSAKINYLIFKGLNSGKIFKLWCEDTTNGEQCFTKSFLQPFGV